MSLRTGKVENLMARSHWPVLSPCIAGRKNSDKKLIGTVKTIRCASEINIGIGTAVEAMIVKHTSATKYWCFQCSLGQCLLISYQNAMHFLLNHFLRDFSVELA